MKVLHISPHFWPCLGGIEKNVEDICVNLMRKGHQSDVCCFNKCSYSKERLPSHEVHKGINIYRFPHTGIKYYKLSPKMLNVVKNYDIIHVHGMGSLADLIALTKHYHKKPIVISTHGGIFHTKNIKSLKKLYFGFWGKHILKSYKKIIAVSEHDRKLFSKVSSGIALIPNGIDSNGLGKTRRRPKKGVFVYVGRVSRNKRIDNLIRTISQIKGAKLYIVGRDWEGIEQELRKISNPNVVFVGEVSEKEKMKYLQEAEFFVSASEYEGFGISVLEAMAVGIPVIVNNISAYSLFLKDGFNGFLVDYSKPYQAATEIRKIMRKDLSKISEKSKRTTREFGWGRVIKKFEEVYDSL